MNRKLKWDEIIGILFVTVSVCFLCISVFLSFSDDIWYDELFTMGLINQPFGKLISITARDVHPPLYFLIVKLFVSVTEIIGTGISQVAIAKLASVFPFLLCLIYAVTMVRRNFGMLTAGLFSFLLLSMPQITDYTVEIRMYGYALFFITAAMLHAYELVQEKKSYVNWFALTFYALAACYTHYFACVAACMVYLYLLIALWKEHRIKEEMKAYLISGACCAAAYLPWLISVVVFQVGQVKENYWIQPLTWRSLGGCVKFLFKPFFANEIVNGVLAVLLFLLYIVLFSLVAVRLWKGRKGKASNAVSEEGESKYFFVVGCVSVLAGIVLFGFLASFLIRPIFVYRYMLPALGVFWLAFAILVTELKSIKYSQRFLMIPVMGLLVVLGLRNYRAFYGEEMWKRVQMEDAMEALAQIDEKDVVVFNFDQAQAVVSCYFNNHTYLWYGEPEALIQEMYPSVHALVEGEFTDEAGILRLQELLKENGKIWFLGSGNAREEILEKWKDAGMKVEETTSVMVERYWFNIYKITEK
ncbi:MAG: hypothetical protein ACI4E5_14455 [Suilimivivens sp.]